MLRLSRDGDQMLPIIPRFGILERMPYRGGSSRLIHRRRTFYFIVGSLIGIYLNSTAALAEVEEVSKDLGRSSNNTSITPSGLSIELLPDNYDNISNQDVSKFHLEEDIIPATVWSLHSDDPIHLDRIRDGVETFIDTGTGARFEGQSSWTRTASALWIGNSMFAFGGLLPAPPLQFQVASCGGSHAERSDLDYCSMRDDILRQEIEQQNSSDAKAGKAALEDVSSPNDVFLLIQRFTPHSTPSLTTPTPVRQSSAARRFDRPGPVRWGVGGLRDCPASDAF